MARDVDPYARDKNGVKRPFAGVNILCSGDFWQLPPPEGGFLGDIPCEYIQASRKFTPAPNIAHGQSLVWSGRETGIQGMTELDTCERTSDDWLRRVQNEFREGNLTEESHAFLHGYPTMNPGSTIDGTARCMEPKCSKRITLAATKHLKFNEAFAKETVDMECGKCKRQRISRKLVANDENDKRFKEKKVSDISSCFPHQ